jgi:hypothetical protein
MLAKGNGGVNGKWVLYLHKCGNHLDQTTPVLSHNAALKMKTDEY